MEFDLFSDVKFASYEPEFFVRDVEVSIPGKEEGRNKNIRVDVNFSKEDVAASFEILNSIPCELLDLVRETLLSNRTITELDNMLTVVTKFTQDDINETPAYFETSVIYDFESHRIVEVKKDGNTRIMIEDLDMYEAYYWFKENCKAQLKNHLRDMMIYEGDKYHGQVGKWGDYWKDCLQMFREQRKCFGAMDKMSKFIQLDSIDGDSVFDRTDYGPHAKVKVIGDVPDFIDRVHSLTDDEYDFIYCNIIGGNSSNNYRLLESLAEYEGQQVFVECMMEKDFPRTFRGGVVRRCRPHNLHAILEMDANVNPVYLSMERIFDNVVIEANYKRNRSFLNGKVRAPTNIRYRLDEVTKYVRRNIKREGRVLIRKKKKITKNVSAKIEEQQDQFCDICFDPDSVDLMMKGKWAHVGIDFNPIGAFVMNYFSTISPKVLFASIYEKAMDKGRRVLFGRNGWEIK